MAGWSDGQMGGSCLCMCVCDCARVCVFVCVCEYLLITGIYIYSCMGMFVFHVNDGCIRTCVYA